MFTGICQPRWQFPDLITFRFTARANRKARSICTTAPTRAFYQEHRVRCQVLDWVFDACSSRQASPVQNLPAERCHRASLHVRGSGWDKAVTPRLIGQSACFESAIGQPQVGPFNYLGTKSSPSTPIEQRRLIIGLCMGNCDSALALSLSSLQQNHFFSDRIAGGASVGCSCIA